MASRAPHDRPTRAPWDVLDRDYDAHPQQATHNPPELSLLDRAVTLPSRWFDRFSLRLMERVFLSGDGFDLGEHTLERLERSRAIYADPGVLTDPARYFERAATDTPEFRVRALSTLRGGIRYRVTFASAWRTFDAALHESYTSFERNGVVAAHVWRHHAPERPTVICLHCWCGGHLPFEERIFAAARLYRMGYHVALMSLPFHGRRMPASAFPGQFFPSPHLERTNEAFGQAVADVRTLTHFLRDNGHEGPLGLMGISLGGYTSSLLASLFDDYTFVIPIIAPASFADLLWRHGLGRPMMRELVEAGVTLERLRAIWSIHCPLSHRLRVDRDDVLIVAGTGDEVVRPAQSVALWEHWNRPTIRWFVGSHLAHVRWVAGSRLAPAGRTDFMGHVLDWLGERG